MALYSNGLLQLGLLSKKHLLHIVFFSESAGFRLPPAVITNVMCAPLGPLHSVAWTSWMASKFGVDLDNLEAGRRIKGCGVPSTSDNLKQE
jgi:hypothetical protein